MKKLICIILSILMLCTTFTGLNITVMANELSNEQANSEEFIVYSDGNIIGDVASSEILHSGTIGTNLQWSLDSDGLLTISGNGAMPDFYEYEQPWYNYSSLVKKLVVESGVTNLGYGAFRDCSNLAVVRIPNSVASISNDVFENCGELTSIIVDEDNPVFDSRNDCNAIIETSTNTLVRGSNSTIIPNSVTSIGVSAFADCVGLISVIIPNSVTSIGYNAFYNCSELSGVTIPNGVTSIASATFSGCSKLTSVVIPNSVTNIESNAFYDCSELTSVVIPDSVKSIGYSAFYGCSGLTSIEIPKSVASIGNSAFCDCSGLTSIIVDEDNSVYDSRNNCNAIVETSTNILMFGCNTSIIPKGVTTIDDYSFYNYSGLTSIVIPDSVTNIDFAAFYGCSGLTSVTILNGVTTIGAFAFRDCSSLTSVTIPNSVTSIGNGAFKGCSGLINIIIPSSVTSIARGEFEGCSGLTSIIVDEDNSVYDSRNNCNAIIETSSNKLICGCATTAIPNSVTSIEYLAFSGCSELTSITIPESVTSIGPNAFMNCSGLTSIIIPNSIKSISSALFMHCHGLKRVIIPESVTIIEWSAFRDCDSLSDVYYRGTEKQWKAIKIKDSNCFGDATIHYEYTDTIGDVNLDGEINIIDATTIQKHLAQLITLDDVALALADTNSDGKVNIKDATQIQKFLAHIIPEL